MNIPLELEKVLNWGTPRLSGINLTKADPKLESSVDQLINTMHPVFDHMIQFGTDYHNFMDSNDPVGLLEFIDKYKSDSLWRLAKFAKGLQMDIEAVKNTLLHPNISNGPVEGLNNLIKCDKRVASGRAKIDLLTAKVVLRYLFKEENESVAAA